MDFISHVYFLMYTLMDHTVKSAPWPKVSVLAAAVSRCVSISAGPLDVSYHSGNWTVTDLLVWLVYWLMGSVSWQSRPLSFGLHHHHVAAAGTRPQRWFRPLPFLITVTIVLLWKWWMVACFVVAEITHWSAHVSAIAWHDCNCKHPPIRSQIQCNWKLTECGSDVECHLSLHHLSCPWLSEQHRLHLPPLSALTHSPGHVQRLGKASHSPLLGSRWC